MRLGRRKEPTEAKTVRRANAAFCTAVAAGLDALTRTAEVPLPAEGEVNLVAVAADGLRLLRCSEAEARSPGAAAYPLYVAGQEVVTQMGLVAGASS